MAKSKSRLGRGLDGLITGGIGKSSNKTKAVYSSSKKKAKDVSKKSKKARSKKQSTAGLKKKSIQSVVTKKSRKSAEEKGFLEIPISKIKPNPYQPRKDMNPVHISELAESIRSEGLLQPIVVRRRGDAFEIIAGERRFRAFQELHLTSIPARVLTASDKSSAVMTLIENLQREELNPIDEAVGYASLVRDFDLTQEGVSDRVGKGRATIANSLRLLHLEEEIQGFLSLGLMSAGQGKVLLSIDDREQRLLLARRIIEEDLSVRETEKLINKVKSGKNHSTLIRPLADVENAAIQDLEKKIASQLNTKVHVRHTKKKGKIVIEYYGNDDLQRILEKLQLD